MEEIVKQKKYGKLYEQWILDIYKKYPKLNPAELRVINYFVLKNNGQRLKPVDASYREIGEALTISKSSVGKAMISLQEKLIIKKINDSFYINENNDVINENQSKNLENESNKYNDRIPTGYDLRTNQDNNRIPTGYNNVKNEKNTQNYSDTVSPQDTHRIPTGYAPLPYSKSLESTYSSKAYKDNIFLKNGLILDSKENTEMANVREIAIQQTGVVTGRIKPSYKDPIQELCEYNAKYRNESFRPENLGAFKKCVDLIVNVWDASRRGDERKARKAFAESVTEDCYSLDLIERFEQAFYAYSKDEFQKQVKAMSLEKWASQWDNWTEVYIERTSNNEIKKIDPGSYWILIREKLKG